MSKGVPDIPLSAYAEEESTKTSKDATDILSDAFMEDRETDFSRCSKAVADAQA